MTTVTGTFLNALGSVRASTRVSMELHYGPSLDAGGIIGATPVSTTTSLAGTISVSLKPGTYLVQVGHSSKDRFLIQVPDSVAAVDIKDIYLGAYVDRTSFMGVPSEGLNYEMISGWLCLKNVTTSLFHPIWFTASPGEMLAWDAGRADVSPTNFMPARSGNYQANAGALEIKNQTTGLYHAPWFIGVSASEVFTWDAGRPQMTAPGLLGAVGSNYRVHDQKLQWLDTTSGLYYGLHFVGAVGNEVPEWDVGES